MNKTFVVAALTALLAVPASAQLDKLKLSDTIQSIKFSGDLRLRDDMSAKRGAGQNNRGRLRYRLRFGPEIELPENLTAIIRLGSGTGEQVSTNQSYDNLGAQKALWIDLMYLKWKPTLNDNATTSLHAGRMTNPLWRTYSSDIVWDDDHYRGDAYGVFSYAGLTAEVEVDLDTSETRLIKVTTVQDIGKAIHPVLAAGQIEGGTVQGLGYALLEEIRWKDGRVWNHELTNYIIPTSADTPTIDVEIVEIPYSKGPFGAKGVGELPMDGPAPAVVAAIQHATGCHVPEIPVTPERLMLAMRAAATAAPRDARNASRKRATRENGATR